MASPPPPYTADPPSSADSTNQPAIFSHGTTPLTASSTFTPIDHALGSVERWSPESPYMQVASPNLVQNTQFPPPPPPSSGGQRNLASSRTHAERFLGAITSRSRNNPLVQSAIEPQQHHTIQVFEQIDSLPPTARRAVSTSAIGNYTSRPNFSHPIQHAMARAIPPPPPGRPPPPPAATSRSQSMNRVSEVTYSPSSITSPRARLPPGRGPALGPVPPTPANWVDEDNQPSQSPWPSTRRTGLLIDTSPATNDSSEAIINTPSHSRKESFGLVRSSAVRKPSAKGLRERRSESKIGTRRDSGEAESSNIAAGTFSRPLQDIITIGGETLAARRASSRTTPGSAQFRGLDEALQSSGSQPLSGRLTSARTTPQSATFSPTSIMSSSSQSIDHIHRHRATSSSTPASARNKLQIVPPERPVSHILHIPNNEAANIPAMQPECITPKPPHDVDSLFTNQALERHRSFLHQEATASNDSERLNLFIQHMIAESKIRRERYAAVFEEENLDLNSLLEGMFEETQHDIDLVQLASVSSTNNSRPASASTTISHMDSQTSRQTSVTTSMDHPTLFIDTTVQENRRGNFIPCLSPIASMSAVTREETESRGRAPSRWWESGSNPSINGDGFKVLERTKRETKYMSAVVENDVSSSTDHASGSNHYSTTTDEPYGENEYPPEKYGFHEENYSRDNHHLPRMGGRCDAPYTPDARKLDFSRLITLPPPHPRRHPAVNNSHPGLSDIRGIVRILSDGAEIDAANENYTLNISEKRSRANSFQQKQQLAYSSAMQRRMDSGTISQHEFDTAEASLESTLATSRLELAKADFSLYESLVVSPLHTIYTTRISRASEALNAFSARLVSDTSTHSPSQPQEAGDELPELLEKLTMLKWLFEARETLHRDLFALLSARNDRYKVTVLLPLSGPDDADEKVSAQSFFGSDSMDRKKTFTTSTYHRWTSFHTIIERHVTKGVEITLSAFWDIAPPLQALLQRVPAEARDLRRGRFDILIPRSEVEENPIYWDHPLRYLWSIVCHAEASTRQFVEGQVSLWCLLQEVREGLVRARTTSTLAEEPQAAGREAETHEQNIQHEIRSGVDDLKEKVAAVEGQWIEGLGGEIGRVKEGLKSFLEVTGAWDDELDGGEEM